MSVIITGFENTFNGELFYRNYKPFLVSEMFNSYRTNDLQLVCSCYSPADSGVRDKYLLPASYIEEVLKCYEI